MATITMSEPVGGRIDVLARPKLLHPDFQEDRRSVYWVDYVPPRPAANGQTAIIATPRVQELALHRSPHNHWKGDRPTPMWPVRETALEAQATERIEALSRHKTIHLSHKMERSPYMVVSPNAITAQPTQRLDTLALPKQRQDRYGVYETEWGQYNPVSPAAMRATHTERLESLATAKGYHEMFANERPVQWPVSDSAQKAIATVRLQQLSRPRSRTMIQEDFDPYKVGIAARRARGTPRLDELSLPIPRKIRTKKKPSKSSARQSDRAGSSHSDQKEKAKG